MKLLRNLFLFLLFLQFVDAGTTYYGVFKLGIEESNPLVVYGICTVGFFTVFGIKIAVLSGLVFLLLKYHVPKHWHNKAFRVTTYSFVLIMLLAYVLVALNNLVAIWFTLKTQTI